MAGGVKATSIAGVSFNHKNDKMAVFAKALTLNRLAPVLRA